MRETVEGRGDGLPRTIAGAGRQTDVGVWLGGLITTGLSRAPRTWIRCESGGDSTPSTVTGRA